MIIIIQKIDATCTNKKAFCCLPTEYIGKRSKKKWNYK